MLGHGGVPWPFVRRSRFVKELQQQRSAYQQTIFTAEAALAAERARHADKEDEFVETVRHLTGFYDAEGVWNGVHTHDPSGVPQHFVSVKPVNDVYTDSLIFSMRVSRMALERIRDLRWVYETVLKDLVAAMVHEAVNPSDPFSKGGT